jgi:DNA-binding CsgD family transcriptional regulator
MSRAQQITTVRSGTGREPGPDTGPDTGPDLKRGQIGGRARVIVALIIAQSVALAIFLADLVGELLIFGIDPHTLIEAVAIVALLLGVGLGGYELLRMTRISRRAQDALKLASGAFSDLLKEKFATWRLTPSEAEVALLTLKGYDGPQIADLRGSARGTVRAQLASIYGKSGCSGRGQFVSLFIDALLDDAGETPPGPGAGRNK